MQYICVTATRDEIRELSFATKWFADLCFTENDRIYRTTELSLQYYLLLALEVWDGKATYRKSWAGNVLVLLDLTLDPPSRSNEDSQT